MDLVDDEDLPAIPRRGVGHDLDEVARLVDLAMRRTVDLERVERPAFEDFQTRRAGAAWSRGRAVRGVAVDGRGEEARRRGLAHATRPREQVRVRQPVGRDGVRQGADDLFLPDDVLKRTGPPLAGERDVGRGIAHGTDCTREPGP